MRALTKLALLPIILWPTYYLYTRLAFFGLFRLSFNSIDVKHPTAERMIFTDLTQCEDLAMHHNSGTIITACQRDQEWRYKWWPAWAVFEDAEAGMKSQGQIWSIDQKTWKATKIQVDNFDGPFVTHGIDIWLTHDPSILYLHAVNHPPLLIDGIPQLKADSRVEVFLVNLTSATATHKRTIKHPLIRMPNDIFSLGPYEFLVTNDHINDRGVLRTAEDLLQLGITSRTNIIHVDAILQTNARVVADGLHNVNGLAHGPNNEVIVADASGGTMTSFKWHKGKLIDQRPLGITVHIDNPSYFDDPYATSTSNASGYVIGGLTTGIWLNRQARDPTAKVPSTVWFAREGGDGKFEKELLLEDDGHWISGVATALIVPIPPVKGEEKREGWVVVTGPWAIGVAVLKADLTAWAKR